MKQIIECIPNFSEGSNQEILDKIASCIQQENGVKLLHRDSGKAANRTVFTYAGEAEAVFRSTYEAIKVAVENIDMRFQKGEHPRIGACDVCPFVPVSGISMKELVPMVNQFAQRVSKELNVPVYLYEESASSDKRRNLARHRIGEYESLSKRIKNGIWLPDFGEFNPKTGGTVMGARNFLVAYNINLTTTDAFVAQEIAYDLRELGRPVTGDDGKTRYKAGKLKKVKAIGWYIKDFDKAQVSINLTDYTTTSLYEVYETTKQLAKKQGVEVSGSELIGLIPLSAILETGAAYFSGENVTETQLIEAAVKGLGLSELAPFEPQKRILEYAVIR